jgi:hypothetical protein
VNEFCFLLFSVSLCSEMKNMKEVVYFLP